MATSTKDSQANIQKLLGLGMTQEQISGEKYGGKMSGGEMQTFITKYGLSQPSSLAMAVNSNQVADQASVSGATGIATRATATDLLSQYGGSGDINALKMPSFSAEQSYKDLLESNGVAGLETQLNELKTQEQTEYDLFNVNRRMEEGKGGLTPINVVEGRLSEQAKNTQNKLDTITRMKGSVSDQLNSKYGTISQLMNLKNMDFQTALNMYGEAKATHDKIESIQLQFPGAKINITDSIDSITSKIQKYSDKETTKQMFGQVFGYIPKGKSSSWMEKKLKKEYKDKKSYEKEKRKYESEATKLQLESAKLSLQKLKKTASDESKSFDLSDLYGDTNGSSASAAYGNDASAADYGYFNIG